jgi:hypothetical protein
MLPWGNLPVCGEMQKGQCLFRPFAVFPFMDFPRKLNGMFFVYGGVKPFPKIQRTD